MTRSWSSVRVHPQCPLSAGHDCDSERLKTCPSRIPNPSVSCLSRPSCYGDWRTRRRHKGPPFLGLIPGPPWSHQAITGPSPPRRPGGHTPGARGESSSLRRSHDTYLLGTASTTSNRAPSLRAHQTSPRWERPPTRLHCLAKVTRLAGWPWNRPHGPWPTIHGLLNFALHGRAERHWACGKLYLALPFAQLHYSLPRGSLISPLGVAESCSQTTGDKERASTIRGTYSVLQRLFGTRQSDHTQSLQISSHLEGEVKQHKTGNARVRPTQTSLHWTARLFRCCCCCCSSSDFSSPSPIPGWASLAFFRWRWII